VHLAIPERTLFRSERSLTKAAVTLVLIKDRTPTPEMVLGIQRLVASSVPELKSSNVIVLDRTGATLSQTKTDDEPPQLEPDRSPLAVAVRGIVARSIPGMRFSVLVTGKPPPARTDINVETYQEVIATLEIRSKDLLNSQQKDRLIEILMSEGLLAPEDRNVVTFEVLDPVLNYDPTWAGALPPTSPAPNLAATQNGKNGLAKGFALFGPSVLLWAGGILALLAAALAALLTWRKSSRESGLSSEERQYRADELRQILDAYRKSVLTHGR
jgi:flagellar M-ring protein FliF